ncbi:NACHT domain-containing protein [Roseateles sp. BYS96W]|uniref:NACHT domain-containing protein n=1 Tax=Pelomonas nitida TaxID=3299027 RepID=A0ABW7G6C2_9BURK
MKQSISRQVLRQTAERRQDVAPLTDFRASPAFVLLGDPGAGKTWSFESEAAECGGHYLRASAIEDGEAPVTATDIVFIDGLDEIRAGTTGTSDALTRVIRWLRESNLPRLRLSCREADWRGAADAQRVSTLYPDLVELHLQPLARDEMETLLALWRGLVPDPQRFLDDAERAGMLPLFGNPFLLNLTAQAVSARGGEFPATRFEVYEDACAALVKEHNPEHPLGSQTEVLLRDAGLLCTLHLLAGCKLSVLPRSGTLDLRDLPPELLDLTDAQLALRSKVFTQAAEPIHRSIAEFLAARSIARRITRQGLPLERVLALLLGADGRPVEALRGLLAWLVCHLPHDSRHALLHIDPLGFVLNADPARLSTDETRRLWQALAERAEENPWFRAGQWVSHPFGPLASEGTRELLAEFLASPRRDQPYQAFLTCVCDALQHAHPLSGIAGALKPWVQDRALNFDLRDAAYEAWKQQSPPTEHKAQLRRWLDAAKPEPQDAMLRTWLREAYPSTVPVDEVFDYFEPRDIEGRHWGVDGYFWHSLLLRQTPRDQLASLADAWTRRSPDGLGHDLGFDARHMVNELLPAVLDVAGDGADDDRLWRWLGMGLDKHGFPKLEAAAQQAVGAWLGARPQRMKAIVRLGFERVLPDVHGHRHFWEADNRLYAAARPKDWLFWRLEVAAQADDTELARRLFYDVAHCVTDPPAGLDVPTLEMLESCVAQYGPRHPDAEKWLENAFSLPLDDWTGEQHRWQLRHEAQERELRLQRREHLTNALASLAEDKPWPGLLHRVAHAYQGHYGDITGDTGLARVQSALGCSETEAQAALDAVHASLWRDDVPTWQEVLSAAAEGKPHYIREALLMAAEHARQTQPLAMQTWSEALLQTLAACWTSYGAGETPSWFSHLCASRAELIAPVVIAQAQQALRRKTSDAQPTLWHLKEHPALARQVLPALLRALPARLEEAHRNTLNTALLAALPLLDADEAQALLAERLARKGLDSVQRLALLLAQLPYDSQALAAVADFVGANRQRRIALGQALREQGVLARLPEARLSTALGLFVEVLGAITTPEPDWPGGIVTEAHERERQVSHLINLLAAQGSDQARAELARLLTLPDLRPWEQHLRHALQAQRGAWREARFKAPDVLAVALTLAHLAPAHPADLRALVAAHLHGLERELRYGDVMTLEHFWNDNGEPRDENSCSARLHEKLKPLLAPQQVGLELEAWAAGGKRVDLRASRLVPGLAAISLPIEVKKDCHQEVWTAWRDQLKRLYTGDPETAGQGIYLVLWFGRDTTKTPARRRLSTSAAEMRDWLRERIPPEDRDSIRVEVLDLSWRDEIKGPGKIKRSS